MDINLIIDHLEKRNIPYQIKLGWSVIYNQQIKLLESDEFYFYFNSNNNLIKGVTQHEVGIYLKDDFIETQKEI